MKIEHYETKTYRLTELEDYRLDPVYIFAKTVQRERGNYGEITIRCWDKAWHSSFGSIGKDTIEQFVAGCDQYYLQKNFQYFSQVTNFDKISKDLDDCVSNDFEMGLNFKAVCDFYGSPYENEDAIPMKQNPDQAYLLRISQAVIDAMKQIIRANSLWIKPHPNYRW